MWLGLLRQLLHRCLVLNQSFYESGSLAPLRFLGSRLSTIDSTADEPEMSEYITRRENSFLPE
jgi:hypothetical protein